MKKKRRNLTFADEAEQILGLEIAHRVNRLGGYGPSGEILYENHPSGSPSVLVDQKEEATATFMSNGSVGFSVKLAQGMDVNVLDLNFDTAEKREMGVPATNVWIDLSAGRHRRTASLMAPRNNLNCTPATIRIVKKGDPERAMWYCTAFKAAPGLTLNTAVKLSFVYLKQGPALLQEVFIKNGGRKKLAGSLWTYFNLHGTQRFVYNKDIWYNTGLPLSLYETVVSAVVPYSDILQVKRLSTKTRGLKGVEATCDYSIFVGNTAANVYMPDAVLSGRLLKGGAHRKMNRFATPAVAANRFRFSLAPGRHASLCQSLMYVTDQKVLYAFRKRTYVKKPVYNSIAAGFKKAAAYLVRVTPDARKAAGAAHARMEKKVFPCFEITLPCQRVIAEYANSVWTGVKELYENCRAHGAKLGDGIEIGTRDRGQDMWPKMKEDPGRVRADLVHALSFMYITHEGPFPVDRPLCLREKLHGMFPRQFPSRWLNRTQEVYNDNRPYADSPLWLIDSLNMYIRETGDGSILAETVNTVCLLDPDHPETSGMVGCEKRLRIIDVIMEVFACFARHVKGSPYGLAQHMYGDWCDPIDMLGTSEVGNDKTRGMGRGSHVRLSAHLFLTLIETMDVTRIPEISGALVVRDMHANIANLTRLASILRINILKTGWEEEGNTFPPGFVNIRHEFRLDGSRPDYEKGESGYTIGSMRGTDYDRIKRRELVTQAYCLEMLLTERDYLEPIQAADSYIKKVLSTVDTMFYDKSLGLVLFTMPFANNRAGVELAGRIGVFPPGCGENGEYHHGQAMMHRYRLSVPGQADIVWKQFKPMMSVMRDESIAGPFETPCTSYVADKQDPHFGKAMYFGLSGSTDWIIEIFQKIAGLQLALHDPSKPDIRVTPRLPAEIKDTLTFKRIIHQALPAGGYRSIPFTLKIKRQAKGKKALGTLVKINGKKAKKAEIWSLSKAVKAVNMEITYLYGK